LPFFGVGDETEAKAPSTRRLHVIVLGLALLILGLILGVGILWTIGIILVIIGVILWILGAMDRAVFGRRYWY
jgi:hypothetical protein